MSPFLIIVLAIISIIVIFQIYSFFKSKRSVGNPIPYSEIDQQFIDLIKGKKGLIYFYSPSCHNCKVQTPIIENIAKKYDNILSIDASSNIKTARAFNIMGTPSTIIFSNNKIKHYFIGVKTEQFLIKKITDV